MLIKNLLLTMYLYYFRSCLRRTLRQCILILEYVKSKGVEVRFHGRGKNEASHYCGQCEVCMTLVSLLKLFSFLVTTLLCYGRFIFLLCSQVHCVLDLLSHLNYFFNVHFDRH